MNGKKSSKDEKTKTFNFIAGFMWPIQGLPTILRYIGYIFPFSFSTSAFRSILEKNVTICDHDVHMAFFVMTLWIIGPLCLCFWLLKKQEEKN